MRISKPVAALLGVVAAFLIACGSGTTSSRSDGAPQAATSGDSNGNDTVTTVKVGEGLGIKSLGNEYTVTVANLRTNVKSGNQFTQPKNGQFIAFDVSIAVKAGQVFANPGMFKLVTAQGTVYDWAIVADVKGVNQDWTVTLNAGQNKSGQAILDVPKDLAGAKIFLQEFDKPAGYWTV